MQYAYEIIDGVLQLHLAGSANDKQLKGLIFLIGSEIEAKSISKALITTNALEINELQLNLGHYLTLTSNFEFPKPFYLGYITKNPNEKSIVKLKSFGMGMGFEFKEFKEEKAAMDWLKIQPSE